MISTSTSLTDTESPERAAESPVRKTRRLEAHRETWQTREWYFDAVRVLAQSMRDDDDTIRSVLLLANARRDTGAVDASVVVKILATLCPLDETHADDADMHASPLRREARTAELMSLFVTTGVTPGLVHTYATAYDIDADTFARFSSDSRWRHADYALRGVFGRANVPRRTLTHVAAIASEFVEDGLAMHVLPALAPGTAGGPVVASMYGQLQWTLAAIHGAGLVHSDMQCENILVRLVEPAANERFQLVESGIEYRFLAGTSGAPSKMPLVKVADYGITDVNNAFLDYCPTSRFSRAPEFFVAFNPVRPDQRKHASVVTHLRSAADTWSNAMSFFTILCGGLIPGHTRYMNTCHGVKYDNNAADEALQGERRFTSPIRPDTDPWRPSRGFVMAVVAQVESWKRLPASQRCDAEMLRLTQESPETLAKEMWRLAMLFGLPTKTQWPDVAHMPFVQLMRNYNVNGAIPDTPDNMHILAPHARSIFYTALASYAPDLDPADAAALESLLARQLQWNPAARLSPRVALSDPALMRLCKATVYDEEAPRPKSPSGKAWHLHLNHLTGRLTSPNGHDPLIGAVEKFHRDVWSGHL